MASADGRERWESWSRAREGTLALEAPIVESEMESGRSESESEEAGDEAREAFSPPLRD